MGGDRQRVAAESKASHRLADEAHRPSVTGDSMYVKRPAALLPFRAIINSLMNEDGNHAQE